MNNIKPKPVILFVDDEQKVLDGFRRQLRKYSKQWNFIFRNSADDAITVARKNDVDLAVIDVNMPLINGLDLLKLMKDDKQLENIQVIMVTGLSDRKVKHKALEAGASDLLDKPVVLEDLVARISNALKAKEYEDRLLKKNRQLEEQIVRSQLMEIVSLLAAGAVHDLKNINQIIQLQSDLVNIAMPEDSPVQENVRKIKKAAGRAGKLSRQILEFGKPVEGVYTVNLCEVIPDIIEMVGPSKPKKATIHYQSKNDKCPVNINPTHLSQLLMNLLLNACQAIRVDGEIFITVEDSIDPNKRRFLDNKQFEKNFWQITIADNGKGMDKNTLTQIFDPHYTTKSDSGGHGLGTVVIKWIIDQYNGHIEVKSEVGKGSEFNIFLKKSEILISADAKSVKQTK